MANPRILAAFAHDVLAVALAWLAAFLLRFNFDIPTTFLMSARVSLFWVVPLFALLFYAIGLYRGLWRFASLPDLQRILAAVAVGAILTLIAVVFLGLGPIPRSVLIMHPVLLAVLMGGSRMAYRSWKEHRLYGPAKLRGQPVLVVGAGESADSLLRELGRSGLWYAVAVVDDSSVKAGSRLRGLEVFGPLSCLPELAERFGVKHAVIAMPEAKASERRHAIELASEAGLAVMTMPSYDDLLAGRLTVSSIRRVELEDLLGREAVSLDDVGIHGLVNSRVMK